MLNDVETQAASQDPAGVSTFLVTCRFLVTPHAQLVITTDIYKNT